MHFKGVSLLITHYNRSSSLESLLKSFVNLGCTFDEIVVSDDGSKQVHLDKVQTLKSVYSFRLITTPKNKGLGNNINKGQSAINTPYTLYVQEDFIPKPLFVEKFRFALDSLETHKEFDMVRFYAYFKYPFLKTFGNGFSEMKFSAWPWFGGYRKFYYYSDHPHLRRSNFFEKFGFYHEGLKVERTEYKMMFSFLQNNGRALYYEDFQELFDQRNSADEPSTVRRNIWRESGNVLISFCRHVYRYVRFNFDLHFTPSTYKPLSANGAGFNKDRLVNTENSTLSRLELADSLEKILSDKR